MMKALMRNWVLAVACCALIGKAESDGAEAVEAVRGEEWGAFADRKGYWGRDLALYVARMNCGLSIPELAALAGTGPAAASKAIQRMRKRLAVDRKLRPVFRKISAEIGVG